MSVATAQVVAPIVRAPRAQIALNGSVMFGLVSLSVDLTNNFEAAKFSVQANVEQGFPTNAAFWSNQTKVTAEIQVGYENNGSVAWQTVLTGVVDSYEIDLDTSSISFNGRDLAAQLIDTKTAQTYSNQTSSEIATLLAQSVGLTPVVTATTIPVGRYYQIDHARMSLGAFHTDITEWDLLVYLAQQEGFDLFVLGTSLYFQPPATAANAFNISWQLGQDGIPISNVINLRLRHSLTLARGVSVTVKSWHSNLKRPIIAKTANTAGGSKQDGGGQDYVFYVPNLTPQQAIALANQRYADITRHLRTIEFEAPGNLLLTPRSLLVLSGTGTAFDASYYPR
jgi:hypothetical protein